MKQAVLERVLWGVTTAVTGAAIVGARAAAPPPTAGMTTMRGAPAHPRELAPDSLVSAAAYFVENDPFRLTRRPPTVAYSTVRGELAPPPEPTAPRPNLVVRGIIGGPPWSAIIEGIPGRSGSLVLRAGDTVAALRMRAVRRDTVIIEAADTTWRLTVKRAP